jgi:hypothetical protein
MSMRRILPGLLALSLLVLCGCRTVRTFDVPYSEVEARLIQRLNVIPEELDRNPRTVAREVEPTLARCLSSESFNVGIDDYKAGQSLSLYLRERYDLGAIGGSRLEVKVRRSGERRTRVSVSYIEKAVGFFMIPYAYVNPGWIREPRIARCVIEPPPTERACLSFEGRSCGPENAEHPCVSADREAFRCVCQGTWSCRAVPP